MTATSISVNKKSVEQLLETGKDKPFIIPEYQRPYAWTYEQIEVLFDDLWDFTRNYGGTERDGTYFLGSIVSYEQNGEQEIIDGQQRITSLFLLLRAIYTKLQKPEVKTEEAKNFITKIEPTIWRADKLTGKVNYGDILLTSRVINNEGNRILKEILQTGCADPKAKDNYSRNYIKFQKLLDQAAQDDPLMIYQFIYALLNQAIVLPICADDQETALRIFSTLNDRGLPLADSDIFKATIYNHLEESKKKDFIDRWKNLEEKATYVGESVQQIFYYYMFYLRALNGDKNTTTPGLRKFYSESKSARLYEEKLMKHLEEILNIWTVVNRREEVEGEAWSVDPKIVQALDILNSYPNEYWKYPVVIYYLSHREKDGFEKNFSVFLNKLIAVLLTRYLDSPTINAVKADILKLNADLTASDRPRFDFRESDAAQIAERIKMPHPKAVRMILKILAYNRQKTLLPPVWEIEHILPQKWQTNYFFNMDDSLIMEKIEHIGNKIPFEKKLNIIAGNGYFLKKKKIYADSKIAIAKEFSVSSIQEWSLEHITERDIRVSDEIMEMLQKWNDSYERADDDGEENQPTPEELAMIERFKNKGWI